MHRVVLYSASQDEASGRSEVVKRLDLFSAVKQVWSTSKGPLHVLDEHDAFSPPLREAVSHFTQMPPHPLLSKAVVGAVGKFVQLNRTHQVLYTAGVVNRQDKFVGSAAQFADHRWRLLPKGAANLVAWIAGTAGADATVLREQGLDALEMLCCKMFLAKARLNTDPSLREHWGWQYMITAGPTIFVNLAPVESMPEDVEPQDMAARGFGIQSVMKESRRGKARKGRRSQNRKPPPRARSPLSLHGGGGEDSEVPDKNVLPSVTPDAPTIPDVVGECVICEEAIEADQLQPKSCHCAMFAHVQCIVEWNLVRTDVGLNPRRCTTCELG